MNTARRDFLSRIGIRRNPVFPPLVEPFDLRLSIENYVDVDTVSIHTVLPAYSPRSNQPQPMLPQQFLYRPPSRTPTYCTVDEHETPSAETTTHHHSNVSPIIRIDPLSVIDEIVNRIDHSFKNPRAWRALGSGEESFFWALRCLPGTGNILNNNLNEIRNRIMGTRGWRVEKFCVIFRGQKLGDLWCRPLNTEVG